MYVFRDRKYQDIDKILLLSVFLPVFFSACQQLECTYVLCRYLLLLTCMVLRQLYSSSYQSFQYRTVPKDVHCWTWASPKATHNNRHPHQWIHSVFTRSPVHLVGVCPRRTFRYMVGTITTYPCEDRRGCQYLPINYYLCNDVFRSTRYLL